MIYKTFKELQLSALGFGAMRLPLNTDGSIDEPQVFAMTDYAMEHGVNYFDTAYPYHEGLSEVVLGKALGHYPRESFYLATKFPGHQIADSYNPAEVFEDQLGRCRVDYFDFYLLHNVCETSIPVYEDPRWGIMDYFLEMKKQGKIRHFGFSSHALPQNLEAFLDRHPDVIEFVQIQLNYLDWSMQDAERKVKILSERGIPVWVMEPQHGGRLSNLSSEDTARLQAMRPGTSAAEWAFRWLQGIPQVKMILSGMSKFDQMTANVATFETEAPLNEAETALLYDIAEGLKNALPCTACRYCVPNCPMGLNIPLLIQSFNDARYESSSHTVPMLIDTLPEDKRPSACLGCGACAAVCPQKINIPQAMRDFTELIPSLPNWQKISEERNAIAAAMRKQKGKE